MFRVLGVMYNKKRVSLLGDLHCVPNFPVPDVRHMVTRDTRIATCLAVPCKVVFFQVCSVLFFACAVAYCGAFPCAFACVRKLSSSSCL